MTRPLLHVQGVRKEFPGTLANDDVEFIIHEGEIHALLGENGAGKSTLVKIIYGVLSADAGEILWKGKPVHIANPAAARAMGIGMVFQHFSLFEAMTVGENISLGMPKDMAGPDLYDRIRTVSAEYGLKLNPDTYVHTLSVGQKQRVETVRCLLQNPKLLIMDEPTSVLTPQEADKLFETLRRLSSEGCAILYISHRLEEILALCHNATIMRQGKVVAHCDPTQETAMSIAEMMMGAELELPHREETPASGNTRLEVRNLSFKSDQQFGIDLQNISLSVESGEILGIAGLAGNGQTELAEVLSGEVRCPTGDTIFVDKVDVGHEGPSKRRTRGVCYVPEERNGHAAVGDMTLWENVLLTASERKGLLSAGLIRVHAANDFAKTIVSRFKVKTAGTDHDASSLSGGNLQKFIIGREILQEPDVMIAMQPTWGVDAGSAAAIHQALLDLAAGGCAVLVVSQDLDELYTISTRIAVLSEGRLSKPKMVADISIEEVGLLMGGLHDTASPQEPDMEATHVDL
jgi:simple sugar transport system ATP-binding protein